MKRKSPSISFLSQPGLFVHADIKVPDKPYAELLTDYNQKIENGMHQEALLLAEKMSILYGVEGLFHYFDLQKRLINTQKNEGEIVDQDVIKILSLVSFVSHISSENKDRLAAYHSFFLGLVAVKDRSIVIREAQELSEYYEKSQPPLRM